MFTKDGIIREYFRLVDIVNDAVQERTFAYKNEDGEECTGSFTLLDNDCAQRLREEYSDRAEAVLEHLRREEQREDARKWREAMEQKEASHAGVMR